MSIPLRILNCNASNSRYVATLILVEKAAADAGEGLGSYFALAGSCRGSKDTDMYGKNIREPLAKADKLKCKRI